MTEMAATCQICHRKFQSAYCAGEAGEGWIMNGPAFSSTTL